MMDNLQEYPYDYASNTLNFMYVCPKQIPVIDVFVCFIEGNVKETWRCSYKGILVICVHLRFMHIIVYPIISYHII